MGPRPQQVTLFLDTNIFMQYQPVDQIPWPDLLQAESVLLLVTTSVMRELDEYKDQGNRRQRERARLALKLIIAGESGDDIRPGVKILFRHQPPRIDFESAALDRTSPDDQLLAAVLDYRAANPDADIRLATHDVGPRIKAKHLGISTYEIPPKYLLPDEPDPLEAKVREPQAELARYQNAQPKLALTFGDGAKHRKISLPRWKDISEEWVTAEMAQLRAKYPKKHLSDYLKGTGSSTVLLSNVIAENLKLEVPPDEIQRYNDDLDNFFNKYEQYLRTSHTMSQAERRAFELDIVLVNTGTISARDIDVYLYLPDGFLVIESRPQAPEEPQPPVPPRSHGRKLQDLLALSQVFRSPVDFDSLDLPVPGKNVSDPEIQKTDRYEVYFSVRVAKQGASIALGPVWIIFGPEDELRPFTVEYRIVADNVPGDVTDQLHVVVSEAVSKAGSSN